MQAQLILSYEEKVCPCVYDRYLRHIHSKCNPSSIYYDDDDTKKEQPAELQKITHQIHVGRLHAWHIILCHHWSVVLLCLVEYCV